MPDTAETYRNKAVIARRLADGLPAADRTGKALLQLALEYDATAIDAEKAERDSRC